MSEQCWYSVLQSSTSPSRSVGVCRYDTRSRRFDDSKELNRGKKKVDLIR